MEGIERRLITRPSYTSRVRAGWLRKGRRAGPTPGTGPPAQGIGISQSFSRLILPDRSTSTRSHVSGHSSNVGASSVPVL
jgi:hypothetical protein